ncbi:MAG: GNAT family N-acetyltransferase [Rhodospirillales bacterium]|nr:GNAT family N-acetyltransferase [Rhodospirillales bacterium]
MSYQNITCVNIILNYYIPKDRDPEDFKNTGCLLALYILPQYYRHGLGTALFKDAQDGLKELGYKKMCTWSLAKNVRAQQFYCAMGGMEMGEEMIDIGPDRFREICFEWNKI